MTISLSNSSEVVTVSDEDYEFLSKKKWHKQKSGYPAAHGLTPSGADTAIPMHRMILNPSKGLCVDHINRNKLDNRRENLRIVTAQQNGQNRTAQTGKKYSTFKGVTWHSGAKKWYAFGTENGKFKGLGLYQTEIEAALAFNFWAAHAHKEFACLNSVHV